MTTLILEPASAAPIPANPAATLTPVRHDPARFVLFPARAFLAFGWIRAGVEKIIEPHWWNGDALREFLREQDAEMLPFMRALVDGLVSPAPIVTAVLILATEVVLGVLLLTGRRLGPALLGASALNVVFVLLGVVTPSAFYLLLQVTLLLALAVRAGWFTEARRIGVIVAMGAMTIGLVPFIGTVHPAEVIDDPAIMLVTVALLVAATQVFTLVEEHLLPRSDAVGQPGTQGVIVPV